MSDIQSVIDKVRKLQTLSLSSNPGEAANAAKAANNLIDKFRLSEAMLEVEGQAKEPAEADDGFIYESGKVTAWKSRLVSVLAKHYGVANLNVTTYPKGRQISRFKLFGRKSDITVTKYMFNYLVLECQRLANLEAKGHGRVFVSSYCEGFVSGIANQLKASRCELQKDATTAAIVLVDARIKEAEDTMKSIYKKIGPGGAIGNGLLNSDAFSQGRIQGKNVHLGSSLTDGCAPRLLK